MSKQVWWVYMIQSVKYGRLPSGVIYIGITTDIGRRIAAHSEGKGAKYTRGRGPWTTLACCSYDNRSQASKVEARLKKMSHVQKYRAAALPNHRHLHDYNPWNP